MKLVIAEKPSVAMALASVLGARTRKDGYVEGNGYIVSWCVGHLVGLCDASEYDEKYKKWRYDDLPIVPECWKHKILEGTKKQFGILKKLMRDSEVNEVICATDAGREGELIFRLVYEQAGCKKPMKRLWISSMEEQAIKDGFASLKDGSCYDSLYQSALCRAKADWLVGINASRLFSVLYNQNLKVGRVQTPTLAMIVDRNQKIKEFTKEKYYMAHIKFDDMDAVTEHFQKKEDAEKIASDCAERMCEVEKDDVKEKTVRPPKLYDLTTLQREANRMFGYTAQQTLDEIKSPKMTAEWEMALNHIAQNTETADEFLNGITELMQELVARYQGISEEKKDQFQGKAKGEIIGKCPRCGADVREGKVNFYCSDRSCAFTLWKNDKFLASQGKKMDKTTAKKFLSKGKIHYKDLVSRKTGRQYEATVEMVDLGEGNVQFNLIFPQR